MSILQMNDSCKGLPIYYFKYLWRSPPSHSSIIIQSRFFSMNDSWYLTINDESIFASMLTSFKASFFIRYDIFDMLIYFMTYIFLSYFLLTLNTCPNDPSPNLLRISKSFNLLVSIYIFIFVFFNMYLKFLTLFLHI